MELLALSRQGFETEAARELALRFERECPQQRIAALATIPADGIDLNELHVSDCIFGRELVLADECTHNLPEWDRVTPLLQSLQRVYRELDLELLYRDVVVLAPDSEDTKPLSKFCTKFTHVFENQVRKSGFKKVYSRKDLPSIYVIFLSYESAYVGVATPEMRSPWIGGMAHIRYSPKAPSRSSMKLEEALLHFLEDEDRDRLLRPGMSAVDLGAAPGGWTYFLVNQEIYVTAVDNGAMDESLLKSDYVLHRKNDAFHYTPKEPVDWLVCDVVDNPFRISDLVASWAEKNLFSYAVVNLKLPMSDKLSCVLECIERIRKPMKRKGAIAVKQLYHDRDEVTVFIDRKA